MNEKMMTRLETLGWAFVLMMGMAGCQSSQQKGDQTAAGVDSAAYKPTPVGAEVTQYDGMKLVWHDEFDNDGQLSDDWMPEVGFRRNEELQWYQPENVSVANGCMVITGKKEQIPNPNFVEGSADWTLNRPYAEYTSGCMTTQSRFSFKRGRMEVRAKLSVAKGAWPAIWLLGNDGEWPNVGEIDVMEYYIKNGKPSVLANACWGSDKRWTAIWDEGVTPLDHFTAMDCLWPDKFHVWRMDWNREEMNLYLDGELMNRIDLSGTVNQGYGGDTRNPFTCEGNDFYILLNLAIGSNGGTPDDSCFPIHYYIDYVRVYQ